MDAGMPERVIWPAQVACRGLGSSPGKRKADCSAAVSAVSDARLSGLYCRIRPYWIKRRLAAPLARRQRRALPWEARPPHAGPPHAGPPDHSSSSPAHRRMRSGPVPSCEPPRTTRRDDSRRGSWRPDLSQLSHGLAGRRRTRPDDLDIRRTLICGYGFCRTGRTCSIDLRIRRLGVRVPPSAAQLSGHLAP